ncbi:MAG: hypothetical protein ACOYOY_06120, partial [Planktothrix agardhii]
TIGLVSLTIGLVFITIGLVSLTIGLVSLTIGLVFITSERGRSHYFNLYNCTPNSNKNAIIADNK